MPDQFDEQEYKRKLIEGGLNERRGEPRRPHSGGPPQFRQHRRGMRPVGSLFELPPLASKPADEVATATATPAEESAAVLRSRRMAAETAELARDAGPSARTAHGS
jgi:hypothetical protein